MDYKKLIERCLGNLEGKGARLWSDMSRSNIKLVSVNAGCKPMGMPWNEIKYLYKGDLNHLECADYKTIKDIDNPNEHRWVVTVPINGNDEKYGRLMFCLKTGIIRGLTFDEFYGGGIVD